MDDRTYTRPHARLRTSEPARAAADIASLIPAAPWLRFAPRGDGHGVLVFPGFGGGDGSTAVLRGYLDSMGHRTHAWDLGVNLGPATPGIPEALWERLIDIHAAGGEQKVSLVGWSLGGVYARLLAKLFPQLVRQVVTLGSPFAGSLRSTSVYPIARMILGDQINRPSIQRLRGLAREPLEEVPSSAIFSRKDGVVPWQIATQTPGPLAENIEVDSSHLGLGFHPAVLYAVADRLAQSETDWRPFGRNGWKRLVYGAADLTTDERAEAQA